MNSEVINLGMALERTIANYPHKGITFISGEKEETFVPYRELYANALKALAILQNHQIKPGDELILQFEDNREFIYYFWACLCGGMIPVPVAVGTTEEQKLKIIKIWKTLNNPYLVTEEKVFGSFAKFAMEQNHTGVLAQIKANTIFWEAACEITGTGKSHNPTLDDIAFIQFSSGSTGDPKGVTLTHRNLLTNINAIIHCARLIPGDTTLSWMPLTHDMGIIGLHLVPLVLGMNQYLMPTPLFIRRPVLWFKKVNEHRANILSSPNFGYKYFLSFFKPELANNWDLSQVRLIFNGAEPISADLCREFLDKMEPFNLKRNVIYPVYGLAEASLAVSFPPVAEEFITITADREALGIGSEIIENPGNENGVTFVDLGYPVNDCLVRICDGENRVLNEKTVGYILIKGNNVSQGYYNNPEATHQVVTPDGWLNTGDLGFIRDGRLVVTGRAKDIIFINGLNYYPQDIEQNACEIDGIETGEVAACGLFNQGCQTEEIIMFVLFKKELSEFVPIAFHLKNHISRKMGLEIKEVIPLKKIPKTTSGKIQRYKLIDNLQNGEYSEIQHNLRKLMDDFIRQPDHDGPQNKVEADLLEIYQAEFSGVNIRVHDNFIEFGGNSLLLTRIHSRIDQLYPGQTQVIDLFNYPTIARLAEFISGKGRPVITGLKLPDDYYNPGTDFELTTEFEFTLEGDLDQAVHRISEREAVTVNDILLALYMFLLKEITGNPEVTVLVMPEKSLLFALRLDFNTLADFTTLFQAVRQKTQNPPETDRYQIQDLKHLKFDPASVIPFFSEKNLLNSINLADCYDLRFIINLEPGQPIHGILEYNARKLQKAKMKELAINYLSLIRLLSEQYHTHQEVAIQ